MNVGFFLLLLCTVDVVLHLVFSFVTIKRSNSLDLEFRIQAYPGKSPFYLFETLEFGTPCGAYELNSVLWNSADLLLIILFFVSYFWETKIVLAHQM